MRFIYLLEAIIEKLNQLQYFKNKKIYIEKSLWSTNKTSTFNARSPSNPKGIADKIHEQYTGKNIKEYWRYKQEDRKRQSRSELARKKLTLAASHNFTVLSREEVAKIVELGLNRTSVMRWECPSAVSMEPKVSTFQIKTCQWKMLLAQK